MDADVVVELEPDDPSSAKERGAVAFDRYCRPEERRIPVTPASVEELLQRSVANRSNAAERDDRSELALELIADTLIALLAELQKPAERPVTSIT